MGRRVDIDDLVDATQVAELLELSHSNSVYLYQARYADMPKPVIDRGPHRARLWLRSEIDMWNRSRVT